MSELPIAFNPTQVAPATGSVGQLPISDDKGHVVIITGDEIKNTASGQGQMLVLQLAVVEGPCTGQTGAHRLN